MTSGGTVVADVPATGVYRLRICHQARHGALSRDVLDALEVCVEGTPQDARCLILTGSGTTFSSGYDLSALGMPPDAVRAESTIAPTHVEALERLESQPLPIVAALNGPALGGGVELALACDLRIGVPDASLRIPAGRLGLVYSPDALERLLAELPLAVAELAPLSVRTNRQALRAKAGPDRTRAARGEVARRDAIHGLRRGPVFVPRAPYPSVLRQMKDSISRRSA